MFYWIVKLAHWQFILSSIISVCYFKKTQFGKGVIPNVVLDKNLILFNTE